MASQDDAQSQQDQTTHSAETRSAAPPVKKKRRWLRVLVMLVVLIALLIGFLPALLSTSPVTAGVVRWVNSMIPGKIAVEDLSLGWLSSCDVRGAAVIDPQGREVLKINSATTPSGLLHIVRGKLGELSVQQPKVVLCANEQGRYSLLDAFGPPSPPDAESTPLPRLNGRVVISDGWVQLVNPDNQQMEMSQINLDCQLEDTNNLDGTLSLYMTEEGKVSGEFELRDLAREGILQPLEASGTVHLATGNDLPVTSLAAFALGQPHASGKIGLKLDANILPEGINADLAVRLVGIQSPQTTAQSVAPIDGQLTATVVGVGDMLKGEVKFESSAGPGQLTLAYPLADQAPMPSAEALSSAIMGGDTSVIPRFDVTGSGQLDLVKLAKAVPALLALREDVEVTGGTLKIEKLAVRGGPAPAADTKLTLTGLATRRAGNAAQWKPVTLTVQGTLEQNRGLQIQQAAFDSGFGKINASGNTSDLQATFQTDLAALHQQVSQVFDIGSAEWSGAANGTAGLKRASDTRIDLNFAMSGDRLRYRTGPNQAQIEKLTVRKSGHMVMQGNTVQQIVVPDGEVNVDGKVIATGSGTVGIASGALQSEINMKQADLAYLGGLIKAWQGGGANYTGSATMQAKLQRTDSASPITSDGNLVLRGATVDGTTLSSDDVTCRWSGLALASATSRLQVAAAQVNASIAHLEASNLDCQLAAPFTIAGSAKGDADLTRLLPVISSLTSREKPPAIGGRLSFNAQGESASSAVKVSGQCTIDDFNVGTGDKVIRDKQVRLTFNSNLESSKDTLDLAGLELDSQLLKLRAAGKITELSTVHRMDVRGEYAGSWDVITALIHELSPGSAETVAFTGSTGSDFEITGPLASPASSGSTASVPLELHTSGLGVNWTTAEVAGLELKQATFKPTLSRGMLDIPIVTIPAATGHANLGGQIDLRQETPIFLLRDRTAILQDINITPELGRELLSRINPMFGQMSKLEGKVSLFLEGVELPLGDLLLQRCAGRGRVDLQGMKIQPAGLLAEALSLLRPDVQKMFTVTVEGIDFELKDGRLSYANCALMFGDELDLRFHGSIGFDDTVDLIMSAPVRAKLLERFGVAVNMVNEYARLLDAVRVEIPMTGTREHPSIDLARVDMKPLIEKAARELATGAVSQLLGVPTGQNPAPSVAPPAPRENLLDLLKPQTDNRRAQPPPPPAAARPQTEQERRPANRPILRALQERQKQREAGKKPAAPATRPRR